jgi:hypothetical protein
MGELVPASRLVTQLDLLSEHYIRASKPPKLEEWGRVSYIPGNRLYAVHTCHRGAMLGRHPEGYPLAYLGMFPADDTWFEVWLEDLWFQN